MIDPSTTASQTEQARLELSLAAEQRLRSNRPRGLVVAAGALVVLATIGLLTGLSAREIQTRRLEVAQQGRLQRPLVGGFQYHLRRE
ncbi:MAG: hypothetical protein K2Q20_13480, partial [Phycisphaerales bacterium]|nr:hypothetical protein [Phycisphaerales bacterium]